MQSLLEILIFIFNLLKETLCVFSWKDLYVIDVDRTVFVIKGNLMFKILLKLKTVKKCFPSEKIQTY